MKTKSNIQDQKLRLQLCWAQYVNGDRRFAHTLTRALRKINQQRNHEILLVTETIPNDEKYEKKFFLLLNAAMCGETALFIHTLNAHLKIIGCDIGNYSQQAIFCLYLLNLLEKYFCNPSHIESLNGDDVSGLLELISIYLRSPQLKMIYRPLISYTTAAIACMIQSKRPEFNVIFPKDLQINQAINILKHGMLNFNFHATYFLLLVRRFQNEKSKEQLKAEFLTEIFAHYTQPKQPIFLPPKEKSPQSRRKECNVSSKCKKVRVV